MTRYLTTTALTVALAVTGAFPALADWREEMPVLRIGLLGGENEADRLRRSECFAELLSERLGVPAELFPASDYAGVMQGLLAGQLDMAGLGASGYAGIYLQDPEAVEPIAVTAQIDGSLGYYAMMYARSDSGIETLEQMEGKSLAFADPNSTSGYLVPKAELEAMGIDIEAFFSQTGFGGGHEQAVTAVLNGQYDGGVTWSSGLGDKSEGFSRGNLRRMVDNGLLDMDDLNIIWQSNLIPNGPHVVSTSMPTEARDIIAGVMLRMHLDNVDCYLAYGGGEGGGYRAVDHAFYENVVDMRRREVENSR